MGSEKLNQHKIKSQAKKKKKNWKMNFQPQGKYQKMINVMKKTHSSDRESGARKKEWKSLIKMYDLVLNNE